jgi:hypothetical protein
MRWLEEHYSKVWLIYTVVVGVTWFYPLPIPYLYHGLMVGYILLSIAWFRLSGLSLGGSSSSSGFLCDSCKFNYGDACRRPERPNATKCPDYQHR